MEIHRESNHSGTQPSGPGTRPGYGAPPQARERANRLPKLKLTSHLLREPPKSDRVRPSVLTLGRLRRHSSGTQRRDHPRIETRPGEGRTLGGVRERFEKQPDGEHVQKVNAAGRIEKEMIRNLTERSMRQLTILVTEKESRIAARTAPRNH